MTVSIDIVSDVICPWCFVGKRRLDAALASLGDIVAEVSWHPFLLDGSIPKEGMDRRDYLTRKFGAERLKTLHDPLLAAAKEAGAPMDFAAIKRTPNTLDAHRLLRWSQAVGKQHDMAERLFMAYWNEGKDIGDKQVLAAEAGAVGLDAAEIKELLDGEADLAEIKAEIQRAAEMGITGVPTFLIAGRYAVVGAQSPEVLKGAILQAVGE
ncbi:MAG TPA: DsbA family oxidoreductase [Aestuariivirga sp.]|nr:DsbA family oxidoreductase [Aestuariivirga sp.]